MKRTVPRIQNASRIPPLPPSLRNLAGACTDGDEGPDRVADLLSRDPALASRVLGCFQALHGAPVESVGQAVTRHGARAVIQVAFSAAVSDLFRAEDRPRTRLLDPPAFWRHALECGSLAWILACEAGSSCPEEAFLAGFLHDIGKMVLWWCLPEDYEALLRDARGRQDLLLEGERLLGGTHAGVGAWMAERWGLSPLLADAIRYHHEPRERISGGLLLVRIVFAAHELSSSDGGTNEREAEKSKRLAEAERLVPEMAAALEIDIAPSHGPSPRPDPDREDDRFLRALEALMEASTAEEALAALERGLNRAFGLKQVLFFLEDPKRGLSAVRSGLNQGKRHEPDLVLPLAAEQGLVVGAFQTGAVLDSFSTETALADEQIMRWMGTEGLLALPLRGAGRPVGVAAVGLRETRLHELSGRVHFLARQAGFVLERSLQRKEAAPAVPAPSDDFHPALPTQVRKGVHEANGPLGIIKNYLKIMDLKVGEQQSARDEIRILNEEIDRVAQILDRLSALTEESPRRPEPVDLNEVIRDLARIMEASLLGDARVRLHLELDPTIPRVLAERNGLKQVLINLIRNAVEAMGHGGNLFVRTRPPEAHLDLPAGPEQGGPEGHVVVTVSDDGPGVPKEIHPQLFRPLQGTKGGRHAGLGLSIVKELIDAMDGTIRYAKGKRGGAAFTFSIPAHPEPEPQ